MNTAAFLRAFWALKESHGRLLKQCGLAPQVSERLMSSSVIAYIACLNHEQELTSHGRGRPRKDAEPRKTTQADLANTYGFSQALISVCVVALRAFQKNPGKRAEQEPLILAGLMSPGDAGK